jgi:hypothetical protein
VRYPSVFSLLTNGAQRCRRMTIKCRNLFVIFVSNSRSAFFFFCLVGFAKILPACGLEEGIVARQPMADYFLFSRTFAFWIFFCSLQLMTVAGGWCLCHGNGIITFFL